MKISDRHSNNLCYLPTLFIKSFKVGSISRLSRLTKLSKWTEMVVGNFADSILLPSLHTPVGALCMDHIEHFNIVLVKIKAREHISKK